MLLVIKDLLTKEAKQRGETISERLFALKSETGETLWEKPIKGIAQTSTAIDEGRIFCQRANGIISLDLKTVACLCH